jgi:hypothetical protein
LLASVLHFYSGQPLQNLSGVDKQQHELAITGGRPSPRVKIKPPRRIGPPRSKLAPGYPYITVERLAAYDARLAQSERALAVIAALDARRRVRAQRGADVAAVAP